MSSRRITSTRAALTVAVSGALLMPESAVAAVFDLTTGQKTVFMPDGTPVVMWGYGLAGDPEISIPGPVLALPPGDTTLTVNLTNTLPVPVSIVIPALPTALTPVWDDGTSGARTNGAQRVVSFTAEAAPGGGSATYEWLDVPAGTYLYHSGSRVAVQVQMGLYGAATRSAAPGVLALGASYDREQILLYSEIDPALHEAVASGSYGTAAYPSTEGYRARYFLVNGVPFGEATPIAVSLGERVLLRLLNAGLQSIVPTTDGEDLELLAEDGQLLPYPAQRYSVLLPPGKTLDAMMTATDAGPIRLFDRALRLTNATGGAPLLARFDATMAEGAPVVVDDAYVTSEDTAIDTVAAMLPSVLANDTGVGLTAVLVDAPVGGAVTLQPDGSFLYTPDPDVAGLDSFTYYATDGVLESSLAVVTIDVGAVADAPLAADDAYLELHSVPLVVAAPGVLGNDSDADGDLLQAELVTGPAGGTLALSPDGSFLYEAFAGTTADSFSYRVFDGALWSGDATVTLTVAVNEHPVAVDDTWATLVDTPVVIPVTDNDYDTDGTIDLGSVTLVEAPTRGGQVQNLGDGTLVFTPKFKFKGTDTFTYTVRDNLGAASPQATVRVNVTK